MPLMFQPFARYVDFEGRARRSEYWLWALFLFVVNAGLTVLQYGSIFMGAAASGDSDAHAAAAAGAAGGMMLIGLLKFVFWLAVLLPSIAVSVRRMHDINRTGWWILFPTAVMIVSAIVVFTLTGAQWAGEIEKMKGISGNEDPAVVFGAMMTIIRPFMWVLIPTFLAKIVTFIFRVTDGTPGSNRFGPDPKGRGVSNVF